VLPACSEQILSGMMSLVQTREDGEVVAESLKVIRHLMQCQSGMLNSSGTSKMIEKMIRKLAGLLSSMTLPSARASVVWLIGEFQEYIPSYAPDMLRILAKGFKEEDTEVKLQIMNMAAKLNLAYPSDGKIEQLLKYVLNMAKYDLDYDLRDRSRLMIVACSETSTLRGAVGMAKTKKTGTGSTSTYGAIHVASSFCVGSLSDLVGHKVHGYSALSEWRRAPLDASVRDVPTATMSWEKEIQSAPDSNTAKKKTKKGNDELKGDFYGDDDSDDEETDSDDEDSDDSDDSGDSDDSDDSDDDSDDSDDDSEDDDEDDDDSSEDDEDDEEDDDDDDEGDEVDESTVDVPKKIETPPSDTTAWQSTSASPAVVDLLGTDESGA